MELNALTVYMDGRYCRYDEAPLGLMTHAFQYGTSCFEGIRGFWSGEDEELYLFRLEPHMRRLQTSSKILQIALPADGAALCDIVVELCKRNGFREDVHVRPFAFKATESVGVRLHNLQDGFAMVAIPYGSYFDANNGLNTCVSSWRRIDDTIAPARAKINGVYVNSALAKSEALQNGFDEAIMLSQDGHVSEGSAENIFLVRDGVLITPDVSCNILEGITRDTIITLARSELHINVVERVVDRSELYAADEVFLCGSAAGIAWVKSADRRAVGNGEIGPVTSRLANLYEAIIRGKKPRYRTWLRATYKRAMAAL
jgi:branched-chain amino acid aminotransferase